jgi:uncharacterized membrane protein
VTVDARPTPTSPESSESGAPQSPTLRARAAGLGRDSARAGRAVVAWCRANAESVCLSLTVSGIVAFAILFGTLAVLNHRNYGTWSYDGAIYDQAIWLVSRGDDTFITVRGLDVWGHHLNLIFLVLAPFYWLGAGPEFLYVVQNSVIALAALPVYLIARERFGRPSVGLLFALAYLMYAPVQWISWINFHPEALCIAPFMFAWWFAIKKRWRWFFVCVVCVLVMREDAALAIIMLGLVLVVTNRHSLTRRRDIWIGLSTSALGIVWYVVATQLVIPHFNNGSQAFYLEFFYGDWGGSFGGIARNVLRHPDRVINLAMKPDRKDFYYKLGLPLGGFAILSPLHLLMAAPQMLASVIGAQPYARQILYQYPSIMIAPIVIASIEGARLLWRRFQFMRWGLYVWLIAAAYLSNLAWSNSPIGSGFLVWMQDNPRREAFDEALDLIPGDAVVASSYTIGPHLSHREESYDWPNPFWPSYWGNNDCERFPSASVIEYLALDMALFPPGDPNRTFVDALIDEEQFEVLYDEQNIMVAKRISPGPDGEEVPVNCPSDGFSGPMKALGYIGATPPAPQPPVLLPGVRPTNEGPATSLPVSTVPRPSG